MKKTAYQLRYKLPGGVRKIYVRNLRKQGNMNMEFDNDTSIEDILTYSLKWQRTTVPLLFWATMAVLDSGGIPLPEMTEDMTVEMYIDLCRSMYTPIIKDEYKK